MFRRNKSGIDKANTPSPAAEPEPALDESDLTPRSLSRTGPGAPGRPTSPPTRPDLAPRRVIDIPGNRRSAAGGVDGECKKLIVGRDITLSGNISACDKLVVEGTVEANIADAALLEIAEGGLFRGNAEVDEADIGGRFEGGLTVRKKLALRGSGRVEGTIRYARLVVEAGGELIGGIERLPEDGASVARLAAPARDDGPR